MQVPVAGSPFAVTVVAAPMCVARCTATLEQSTVRDVGVNIVGDRGTPRATVNVNLSLVDAFGNPQAGEDFRRPEIEAWAHGPEAVELHMTEQGSDERSRNGQCAWMPLYSAELPLAGHYTVSVSVNGNSLGGWPRALRVAPGEAKAARCRLLPTVSFPG